MSKRRSFDRSVIAEYRHARLSYRQRVLWFGLILAVDDQGRMRGSPALVRASVFPYEDLPLKEVENDLQQLEQMGFIQRYSVEEEPYLQVNGWHQMQSHAMWLGLSDLPAPPGWVDHARYQGKGGKIITRNWETRSEPSE